MAGVLCSLSAFALSSQKETEIIGDSLTAAASETDIEQSVSEDISENVVEENIEMERISEFRTADTCEKVEAILGEPISMRGSYSSICEYCQGTYKFF